MKTSADAPVVALIPMPASVNLTDGSFTLTPETRIIAQTADLLPLGDYLANQLNPATGYTLAASTEATDQTPAISLSLVEDAALGEEGYRLVITPATIAITAAQPAGLFYGIQTLRQLLPAAIESDTVQDAAWVVPTGTITDAPRFAWRGAMLDVARHFFSVDEVKRYIDLLAAYKINRLHLHLADDQGWRIMIDSWPNLALIGGTTAVGGGEGGYYTKADYSDIVAYAQERFIVIIPEIDMPGHTNAALASYPELNCNGKAPDLYTGTEVGFSTLCFDDEITYTFLDDVIRELAEITPGPYIHIGGDEAKATKTEDYIPFIERVQTIVEKYGKHTVGWEEIAQAKLLPSSVAQHWNSATHPQEAVAQGAKVIMSPASKAYLDMKYDNDTPLGLSWAGLVSVKTGYDWDPAEMVSGVDDENILGVEAPLWSETLEDIEDIEYMAFPRLPGYAEIGWSPAALRDWDTYKDRLGAQGPRFTAMGINFYSAPEIPWQ